MADLVCPSCELPCEKLVLDAAGTPRASEVCERCHLCSEIMEADVHFISNRRYDPQWGESVSAWMRRMHEVLLPDEASAG